MSYSLRLRSRMNFFNFSEQSPSDAFSRLRILPRHDSLIDGNVSFPRG